MIIFRADGSSKIGLGHFTRSLALAEIIKDFIPTAFAIRNPYRDLLKKISAVAERVIHLDDEISWEKEATTFITQIDSSDIVVLDGYNFNTPYQSIIKNNGNKIVSIDDIHQYHFVADVIINQGSAGNTHVYSKESYTKLFLGLDYALLRPPFLISAQQNRVIKDVDTCFVNMGASDIENISLKIIKTINEIDSIKQINLLIGSVNPHKETIVKFINTSSKKINLYQDLNDFQLCDLLKESHVAICPSSSISIEAASVGMAICAGITAENQKDILNLMKKNDSILDLGDLRLISPVDLKNKFCDFISNPTLINIQILNQKKMIDGKSNERLLNIFQNLLC